jgi:putative DNA-invertase from lambdoid prophage Rac
MVYGYIRVSTDKQSLENQKFELSNFAQKRQWTVFKWVEEIISGTKKIEERQLGILLSQMAKGDTLLVSELSRLGRNLLQIMSILNFCI